MCALKSQDTLDLFAIAPPGLEQLVAAELKAIGLAGTATPGGVEWQGGLRDVYRANLLLRTASRIVVRVAAFKARTFFELERHANRIDWRPFLSTSKPVFLRVTSKKSKLYHEGAIAERLHRTIRAQTGAVPVDQLDEEAESSSAQMFIVRVVRDEFTISADSSGALLHFRGYRQALAKAPLRENLAAALLQLAEWTGQTNLLDPMCGSGVIPIEAALSARNIPPALAAADRRPRRFAFESWPMHERRAWETEVQHARAQIRASGTAIICGSDRDAGAVAAARANAERAGVAGDITFTHAALTAAPRPPAPLTIVTNPPYGMRVSEGKDLRNLYATLARLAEGARLVALTPDPVPGARPVAATRNGGIDVRVFMAGR